MGSYKFWDSHQSDANPRNAMETVLPLFLYHFLAEMESDNGPICTCLNDNVTQPFLSINLKAHFYPRLTSL